MQNWKKALIWGSIGAGAAIALSGRRSVGLTAIAGGLAVLASEYPERFEAVLESAPEYISRASAILATLTKLSEKYAENAERRSVESFRDAEEFV